MRARSLELEQLEDEVAAIVADLELYTYYQLLDLQPDGSCAVAEYNYNVKVFEYQKIQKDDRASAALIQGLALIIERMGEARQVLGKPELRAEYDRGLEEGNTRHAGVVAERARPGAKQAEPDAQQRVLQAMTSRLEREIGREYLAAPDAEVPDTSDGIEADLLDQETSTLRGELASYGVNVEVKEAIEESQPIDGDYLEKASLHLRQQIYKDGAAPIPLTDEEEDVSAANDLALVTELTEKLHEELKELGVPENEEVEPEALPIDSETLERLVAQEQQAVIDLEVDTTIKADAGLHDGVIAKDLATEVAGELEEDLGRMGVRYAAPSPSRRQASREPSAEPEQLRGAAGVGEGPREAAAHEQFDLVIPVDGDGGEPAPAAPTPPYRPPNPSR